MADIEPKNNIGASIAELSSTRSTRVSLNAIHSGEAGLNAHRQSLLARTPKCGDWAAFPLMSLELEDTAYLTAMTGDEFAILRGKKSDILYHGTPLHCSFQGELFDMLMEHKLCLVGHSHPGEDVPEPSADDRQVLLMIGQEKSIVISARTGRIVEFTADPFEL